MAFWKLVSLIIGIIVLITVAYAFAGIFLPKIAKLTPGINESVGGLLPKPTPSNEVEPPDSVKEAYNNFLTAFDNAKKSGQKDCFVPYAIKPLRSDFKEFSILIENAQNKLNLEISNPAPEKYQAIVDGVTVDCVIDGQLAGYVVNDNAIEIKNKIRDFNIVGYPDGRVTLNKDIFLSTENYLQEDPSGNNIDVDSIDGNAYFYKYGGGLCFINLEGYSFACGTLSGKRLNKFDCINNLKEKIKNKSC